MAKDMLGFEAGRKRDKQGRPLKLQTPPASEAYRENWDRMFGKISVAETLDIPEVKETKDG